MSITIINNQYFFIFNHLLIYPNWCKAVWNDMSQCGSDKVAIHALVVEIHVYTWLVSSAVQTSTEGQSC